MQREKLLLEEMIDAAQQAILIAADATVEALVVDRLRRDALLWNFTVLGEASTQLSQDFKQCHDTVNWVRPARLRNRIVHGYWSVDLEILLTTAQENLAEYVEQLQGVLVTLD